MYSTLRRLAQNSLFYTFANSIEAIAPLILAVILTRIIAPAEYGVWVLFIALVTFVRPIVNLSAQDALRMHFFELNSEERADLVWSSIVLGGLCTCILVFVSFMFDSWLAVLLSFPQRWLPAIPITALLYAQFYFLLAYLQFASRRKMFLLLHVVQTVVSISLITWLVITSETWRSVVAGKLIGLSVAILLGITWLARHIELRAATKRPPKLKRLATFGLLYLPTGLGLVAIPLTDRLIVTKLLGMEENGYFGAAALFGSAVYVAVNGFIHAWMPWLFATLRRGDRQRVVNLVSLCFFIALPVVGLCSGVVANVVAPWIIGQTYAEAFDLIAWSIAGTISMGYFFHNQAFLHFRKAVVAMSVCSSYCILANAVFSYYGALNYGSRGVFAATVVAFVSAALISRVLRGLSPDEKQITETRVNA